jgi:hypothetical protein
MTPLQIEMMFHINARSEPLEGIELSCSSQFAALAWFISEDLVVESAKRNCGYALTARGQAYLYYLTSMPLPVAEWRIPIAEVAPPQSGKQS